MRSCLPPIGFVWSKPCVSHLHLAPSAAADEMELPEGESCRKRFVDRIFSAFLFVPLLISVFLLFCENLTGVLAAQQFALDLC